MDAPAGAVESARRGAYSAPVCHKNRGVGQAGGGSYDAKGVFSCIPLYPFPLIITILRFSTQGIVWISVGFWGEISIYLLGFPFFTLRDFSRVWVISAALFLSFAWLGFFLSFATNLYPTPMADYNTSANIVISINGKQAKSMLAELERKAEDLKVRIDKAAKSGDKMQAKKLSNDLKQINREMEQLNGTANRATAVLKNIDKANPKQLNAAIRQLNRELQTMERGSAAWNKHAENIRRLKAQLQSCNRELAAQRTGFGRLNDMLNRFQTAIMGAIAAATGFILAGRSAVKAYAEMDEQLANTRKYTGMSADEVNRLNEAFKKMDTRTSREQLNMLAQEAGRLGKNTLEDVQGYVEAADVINVALVDLGEGATQTIAKLTNIFGVDKMLGTRDAMLAVGSTVNVLSQNCTASKPYLVDFAQRMAGIGAQAGLTIPEILAFGAVLDANGQKVEMSATALQKVIMNLANKNGDIAKRLGIDAGYLNKVLKSSARDGLMLFLEALKKIGDESGLENATMTLAPVFADIDMDAARVSQVLSTLAGHIEEVKWQIGEADKAFTEASSASNEYGIFNSTTQASLDKAKKKVKELKIELGEQLVPVMRHVLTSSSIMLRVLKQIVGFVIDNKTAIIALGGACASYWVATKMAVLWTKAHTSALAVQRNAVSFLTLSHKLLIAAISPLKVAYAAAASSLAYFSNGMTVTYGIQARMALATSNCTKAVKALSAAFKATPFGVVVAGAFAVVSALTSIFKTSETVADRYNKIVAKASQVSEESIREREQLEKLIGTMKGASKGSDEYNKAKNTIIKNYGAYLSGVINEKGEINDLTAAYNRLTTAIKRSAMERSINEAQKGVDDEWVKTLSAGLNLLEENLIGWGATIESAAEVKAEVTEAIMKGEEVSPERMEKLKTFAKNQLMAMSPGGKSDYFLNQIPGLEILVSDKNTYPDITPADVVKLIYKSMESHTASTKQLNKMRDSLSPYASASDLFLAEIRRSLEQIYEDGSGVALSWNADKRTATARQFTSKEEIGEMIAKIAEEQAYRGAATSRIAGGDGLDFDGFDFTDPSADPDGKTPDRFEMEKMKRDMAVVLARLRKAEGKRTPYGAEGEQKPYTDFDYRTDEAQADVDYYNDLLKRTDLAEGEIKEFTTLLAEAKAKLRDIKKDVSLEQEEYDFAENSAGIKQQYADGVLTQKEYNERMEDEEIRHYETLLRIYENADKLENNAKLKKERQQARLNLQSAHNKRAERIAANDAQQQKSRDTMKAEYFGDKAAEKKAKYNADMALLNDVYNAEIKAAGDSAAERLRIEEAFQIAKTALAKKYGQEQQTENKNVFTKFNDWLGSDGGKAVTGTVSTLSNGMGSIFSEVTKMMQADIEMQTRAIEKRYDAEISRAEGNSYKVKKLEKQKEKEIAKAKSEANRKMFAMQVIQAVAQTAQNAIAAYGSAAAIPVVGFVMAPIAAAMAVAAGMLQIAAIKKQQQASESQGYSKGGFTPPGRVDEEAGVVHAGEWVASQKLVNNPRSRVIINALDAAQRNNTIGSISPLDVSRSITAPVLAAAMPSQTVVNNSYNTAAPADTKTMSAISSSIESLNRRLADPFVTVNTVTGDTGINKAQEEYRRLMKNKSPKTYAK